MALSSGDIVVLRAGDAGLAAVDGPVQFYSGTPGTDYPDDDFSADPNVSADWTNLANISHNAPGTYIYPTGGGIGLLEWANIPNAAPAVQLRHTSDIELPSSDPWGGSPVTGAWRWGGYRLEPAQALLCPGVQGKAAVGVWRPPDAVSQLVRVVPGFKGGALAFRVGEKQHAFGVNLWTGTSFVGPNPGDFESILYLNCTYAGVQRDVDSSGWLPGQSQFRGPLIVTVTDAAITAAIACSDPGGTNLSVSYSVDSDGRWSGHYFTIQGSTAVIWRDLDKTGSG